jgi:acyl carrier protein
MLADCSICGRPTGAAELCGPCAGLLRWVRGYFAHVPGLAEEITPETRFIEDLGVDSLDWMCWPAEAEEKLDVVLDDEQCERIKTIGQFIRTLRDAGAHWPEDADVRLRPRRGWWSNYHWAVVGLVEGQTSGGGADPTL